MSEPNKLYAEYRRLREEHTLLVAHLALRWAKDKLDRKDWILDGEESTTFVRDGFTVEVKLASDNDFADTSTYGEFKRAADIGGSQQLEWHNGKQWYRTDLHMNRHGDIYGRGDDEDNRVYFHNSNYSFDEEYAALRKRGLSRSVAREIALKTMADGADFLRRIYSNDIGFVGIVATVTLDGEEYGHDSCWGFEFESWRKSGEYINDSARSIVNEALSEAKKQLGEEEAALLKKCNETVKYRSR